MFEHTTASHQTLDEIPLTRFAVKKYDAPSLPEPYISMIAELGVMKKAFEREERIRHAALNPIRLIAGQSTPSNGKSGRHTLPPLPEVLSGAVYSSSI